MFKKRKAKKQNVNNKEIKDVKVYSENLVKNLVNEASENTQNTALFEKQYEEDFYTKEVNIKNTYPSSLNQKKSLEKYKNEFFEDFEEDEEEYKNNSSTFKVISTVLIFLLTVSTLVLSISLIKTKISLVENTTALQKLLDSSGTTENKLLEEDLKSEIAKLEEENEKLKLALEESSNTATESIDATEDTSNSNSSSVNTLSTQESSNSETYIIQSGDTAWDISKKVYGTGSEYQKILDANGLTESSILQEGEILIIP